MNRISTKPYLILFAILIFHSCNTEKTPEFLRVENKTESTIYTLINGLPIENQQKEMEGLFTGIIEPDSCLTIEISDNEFYLTSDIISPIYNSSDYLEIEIFVFKGQNKNYQYFTGKDRDTLYLEQFNLSKIILDPIKIKIE